MTSNITMVRGDTKTFSVTVTDNGSVVNLTGGSMTMTAKWSYADANVDAVFQRTVGTGITFTSPTNGVASITIAPENTSSLPNFNIRLKYDIQFTSSTGTVLTFKRGSLLVQPDVTL